MSGNLPTMVIVTSYDCSACRTLHSTGNFNRDLEDRGPAPVSFMGHNWNSQFFWELITGESNPNRNSIPKFRVMELEITSMRNVGRGPANVMGFTEFNLEVTSDDININRNTWERCGDEKGNDAIMYLMNDTVRGKGVKDTNSFNDLVARKFPQGLFNILAQYPSFIWFSPTQWNRAMRDPTYTPYANIYGLVMTDVNGKWTVTGREGMTGSRATPGMMGSVIASNLSVLDPPVELVGKGDTKEESSLVVQHSATSCSAKAVKIVPLNNKGGYHRIRKN